MSAERLPQRSILNIQHLLLLSAHCSLTIVVQQSVNIDYGTMFTVLVVLVVSITVHELSHAIAADALGDDTPRLQGRITAAPWAHFDPLGAIMIVVTTLTGFGIGWGKPVQTNPRNFRIDPRLGMAIVAFAGPLSNILMAVCAAMALRFGAGSDDTMSGILELFTKVNVGLALFNLLPIYPLDGSHLLTSSLPPPLAARYQQTMAQLGIVLFLFLVFTGILSQLIIPAENAVFAFLVGIPQ